MEIINPYYATKDQNIFTLREVEFSGILDTIKTILIPAEELGFQITELDLKESRTSRGELNKTIKQTLAIKLQKETYEIDISMAIPKLIDKNYIIINGRKKLPLFQLFDTPIVTRGKNIKFRSNVSTIMISDTTKESPFVYISFLGKKIPLSLVMFAYYGSENLNLRYDLANIQINNDAPNLMTKLLIDLKGYYDSGDLVREDLIKEIGANFTTFNPRQKGEDYLYALDLILKVDPYIKSFIIEDTIMDELIDIIETGRRFDDTDFINKRIRCIEYMVIAKVSKSVFDLCMANRTSTTPKFNINSTQILSECNVSDIVQFDFSINPIDEITKLSRTSLVGPGGFKRENVPSHLRDISQSMFGRMCPIDTPDRDNCGVLQNLLVNTNFDERLKFTEDFMPKLPISAAVSMIPFIDHDDGTRGQMAASQARQGIMLKDFDVPLIKSGCESLYTKFTQFVKIAKDSGEVVYMDKKWLIVRYDSGPVDIFDISYRRIYVQNMDFLKIYVQLGDRFKKNDILAESNFCTDGSINIGRNLLTAIMIYYGYNYEDGIAISDRLVNEDVLTSVHYMDLSFILPPNKVLLSLDDNCYRPFPNLMETLNVKDPYAILKEMPAGPLNFGDIFNEPIKLLAKKKIIITDITIYANNWNDEIPEYKRWIDEKIKAQEKEQSEFEEILYQHLSFDEAKKFVKDNRIDKFADQGKYKIKAEKLNGIFFEIFGVHTRQIKVGDKIGNRHGNKGVISAIIPHENMPRLEDGRHVDICINPLGIISRMNIGQLFELHLAMATNDLKIEMLKMLEEGKSSEEIKAYFLGFIKLIDNTDIGWYYTQMEENLPEVLDLEFIKGIFILQPPFESLDEAGIERALEYTGTLLECKVFDPMSGKYILNKIAVGYVYFIRMVHIAESRLAARGVGTYAKKTLQPLAGRKNKGGQRCGEMETACLIAHDATVNLHEMFTTKSDCIDLKNAFIRNIIDSDEKISKSVKIDDVSESVKLLQACLTVVGVKLDNMPGSYYAPLLHSDDEEDEPLRELDIDNTISDEEDYDDFAGHPED